MVSEAASKMLKPATFASVYFTSRTIDDDGSGTLIVVVRSVSSLSSVSNILLQKDLDAECTEDADNSENKGFKLHCQTVATEAWICLRVCGRVAGSDQREGPETESTLKLSGPSVSLLTLPPRRINSQPIREPTLPGREVA